MAKKKKTKKKTAKKKQKRGSRIQFLRELYKAKPSIANDKALELLLAKFPESNADVKSIITWKNMLRAEGIDIPKQRAGKKASKKKAKKKGKKKAKKR